MTEKANTNRQGDTQRQVKKHRDRYTERKKERKTEIQKQREHKETDRKKWNKERDKECDIDDGWEWKIVLRAFQNVHGWLKC